MSDLSSAFNDGFKDGFKPLFTWKDRAVKLAGGYFHLSRIGAHEDFNYLATDPDAACAGTTNFGSAITQIEKIDEDKLRLHTADNKVHILEGDPCKGGRCYEDKQ